MVILKEYFSIMLDRPKKLSEEDVGYGPAPEGSEMTCVNCLNYYRRSRDGHPVCQIFRSDKTDEEGVLPDWRCQFYTITGDVFPLLEEDEEAIPY